MNRSIILLSLALLPLLASAQKTGTILDRWRNSVGVSVHLLPVKKGITPAFGLYYNPQINIVNRYTDFSLAATMPMTLGVHIKDSWIDKTFFYGHVPAVLETNFGHYSTRNFYSDIGGGVGAGYGLQVTDKGLSSGFVATAAARTWFFRSSLTIRYMFHLSLQGSGYNTHAIAVAVNMGNYFKKLIHMNKISKFQNFK